MKNEHIVIIGLLSVILISSAVLSYVVFVETHSELLVHLTAVFIEILLSLWIIDFYLGKVKKDITFKLYCNAGRGLVYSKILRPFNPVFSQFLNNADFVNFLGQKPSNHNFYQKEKRFQSLAHEFVSKISESDVQNIMQVLPSSGEAIEEGLLLNLLNLHEELYDVMSNFNAQCYRLSQLYKKSASSTFYSSYEIHLILTEMIENWLYIINNYIFYWDRSGRSIRHEFKENILEYQRNYHQSLTKV